MSAEKRNLIISWCLYVGDDEQEEPSRLPEYLFGLKLNQNAAKQWFPDWSLRLYVDETLETIPAVWQYVQEIAAGSDEASPIELVRCRNGAEPTVERYRAVLDENVDACLVRDVDSVLSKTDADLVSEWLNDEKSMILKYREHKMYQKYAMGGGISSKRGAFNIEEIPFVEKKDDWRGTDETVLGEMLEKTDQSMHTVVVTRMTKHGIYCLKSDDLVDAMPEQCKILWPVPFFDQKGGYGTASVTMPTDTQTRTEESKSNASSTLNEIVDFVRQQKVCAAHIYSHQERHVSQLICDNDWIR